MKSIRRSFVKGNIGAPTSTYSSVPTAGFASIPQSNGSNSNRPSTTPAPAPPKRVIKALEAHEAVSPRELSFQVGDFFHVVSDNGGDDFFDAANPMTGARGLVPQQKFQVLGRNVRETAQHQQQQQQQRTSSKGSHSSGSASPAFANSLALQQGASRQQPGYLPPGKNSIPSNFATSPPVSPSITVGSRPPSQPTPKPQPLYGIVQYDFTAERADELDAKKGEPIIVIAQSNHEWFVAKPIGRLGGPGLIPVAFVEIQDISTGKPIENVEELIRSAVVPKVEEWKKMTADYRSASIPLGRFDFAEGSGSVSSSQFASNGAMNQSAFQPSGSFSAPPPSSANSRQQQAGGRSVTSHYDASNDRLAPDYPPTHLSQSSPALAGNSRPVSGDDVYYEEDEGEGEGNYSYRRERKQYGLVVSASVESFHQEEGSFWFHLRANFSTGASLILYRLYQDFYDFQIALMDKFPVEAGRIPPGGEASGRPAERILPMMPGPTEFEDEVVCAQRVHDLSIYLDDLCRLPDSIRGSGLMYEFLVPRAGDVEVAAGNGNGDLDFEDETASSVQERGNAGGQLEGQYGELVEYLDQMEGPDGETRGGQTRNLESGMANLAVSGQKNGTQGETNGQPGYGQYAAQQQRSSQTPSGYSNSSNQYPSPTDDQYAQQVHHPQPNYASPPLSQSTASAAPPFVKIKIFHRNTDDLIAIRVPPSITFTSILAKVQERLGNDVANLRYREEVGTPASPPSQAIMAGGARLVSLENDSDLSDWINGGSRLVLYAD